MNHESKSFKPAPLMRNHYLRILIQFRTSIKGALEWAENMRDLFFALEAGIFTLPFTPTRIKAGKTREKLLDIIKQVVHENMIEQKDTINELRKHGKRLNVKARTN